jgi:hypothetical protein
MNRSQTQKLKRKHSLKVTIIQKIQRRVMTVRSDMTLLTNGSLVMSFLSFKKPQTQRRFRVESKCANFAFQRLEL